MITRFLYLTAGLLLASCKSIQPTAPAITVEAVQPPVQDVSMIHIPVEMELKSHFKAADESVPMQFKGREDQCEDVSYAYTFDRKPIKIEGSGKEVGIHIDGKYALNLNYCAKCTDLFSSEKSCVTPRIYASCGVGEPMRRIEIDYNTKIDLKPDFKLNAKTTLEKVNPKDKCEITVFRYNATDQLVKEVKKALKDLGGEIDKQIEALDIRKEAEGIWNSMAAPMPVSSYGFLNLNPNKLAVNDLSINGSKLTFNILMEAFPTVTLHKPNQPTPPLPDLSSLKGKPGFQINLNMIATYDSLSSKINQAMAGKVIPIKKQQIILQQIKVYGAASQQISFEVKFTGSKSGTMFFTGTPVFNDSLQEISFPDLSFDIETKNTLLKSAKWLFNDKITDMMRSYARYNMQDILKQAATEIEKQMNGEMAKGVRLKGKMEVVRVKKVFPASDHLLIQSELKGKLHVFIE